MVSSSYSVDTPSSLPVEPEASAPVGAPRAGRWLLVVVILAMLVGFQLAMSFILLFALGSDETFTSQAALEALIESPTYILYSLIAAGGAGLLTIAAAFAWPWLWSNILMGKHYSVEDWLAWRKPRHLSVGATVLITIPILIGINWAIYEAFGDSSVESQLAWFSTPLLQVVASIAAVLIAPLAEELAFRSALYNALLPGHQDDGLTPSPWMRHVIPVVFVSLIFALIHLPEGFTQTGSIIAILTLSLYLTLIRAYTGSTKASTAAHITWNTIGVIGIILSNSGLIK